jgi:hypothetical protein
LIRYSVVKSVTDFNSGTLQTNDSILSYFLSYSIHNKDAEQSPSPCELSLKINLEKSRQQIHG